ncbi:MAG: hypothetical protein H6772_04000 [Pseudomonadales bacterium]|nr:hypothetical protein [Pseudomonadales bacterium]
MQFRKISFPNVVPPTEFPDDVKLSLPNNSNLPTDQQHYLLFIPWEESYLIGIPRQYVDFFKRVLPHLHTRTTDVHTAVCLGYLDELLSQFDQPINERVVALALILHDSGWSKLSEKEIAMSLGVSGLKLTEGAKNPKEKHALESAKITTKMLNDYDFIPPLNEKEKELIIQAVLYHDKPEEVAGAEIEMPIEIQLLVDLDHLWSFTHQNFWQDTLRKGVQPKEYVQNLQRDIDDYFVTDQGKELALKLLNERLDEVEVIEK